MISYNFYLNITCIFISICIGHLQADIQNLTKSATLQIETRSLYPIPPKPLGWDGWSFNRKIAWRGKNLDPRIPYKLLVDKIKVKDLVSNQIPVAKTLFITNNPDTIFLENLPNTFLMKPNNASGRGLLVRGKMIIASRQGDPHFKPTVATNHLIQTYAKNWLENTYAKDSEIQYGLIEPYILFEEYLENISTIICIFCFYGKAHLIQLISISNYEEKPTSFIYYDLQDIIATSSPENSANSLEFPKWLSTTVALAEKFSKNIDHVRVDFMLNNEDLYFSEFTFTSGQSAVPRHLQKNIGEKWHYPDPNLYPEIGNIYDFSQDN